MRRIEPGPGQESVWDYPRPPALEPVRARIRVIDAGIVLADTRAAVRILETSHPPTFYLPPADVAMIRLAPVPGRTSFCEHKGVASYWALEGRVVAWSYPRPTRPYATLADHLAFYASRVDECWVDEERARAQEGDFYGGWITSRVVGPFKGAPGTSGW